MNRPVDHPDWSDERLESLLRKFFRNEMPPELRDLRDSPVAAADAAQQHRTGRRRRGSFAGIATAATAVAAVWVALMLQAPVGEERSGLAPKSRANVAEDADGGPAALDWLERPGIRQPVEIRSRGGIEHVDATEPGLEIEYPEWEADIRIYGAEEQKKTQPADPD